MNDEKIKKKYSKKIKLYNQYNQYYYDKSDPLVSDQKFDNLKKEILQLEKKVHQVKM